MASELPPSSTGDEAHTAEFVQLIAEHQRRLYGFIRALVIRTEDVEDLLQETIAEIWQRRNEFELGTNFGAWSMTIARHRVFKHHRKASRRHRQLSEEVIDSLADEAMMRGAESDLRVEALRECVQSLARDQQRLAQYRYRDELAVSEIATKFDRNAKTIYRMLGQMHRALLACVRRRLDSLENGR